MSSCFGWEPPKRALRPPAAMTAVTCTPRCYSGFADAVIGAVERGRSAALTLRLAQVQPFGHLCLDFRNETRGVVSGVTGGSERIVPLGIGQSRHQLACP